MTRAGKNKQANKQTNNQQQQQQQQQKTSGNLFIILRHAPDSPVLIGTLFDLTILWHFLRQQVFIRIADLVLSNDFYRILHSLKAVGNESNHLQVVLGVTALDSLPACQHML